MLLLERIKTIALPNRQREACYLLVMGTPTQQIAEMLNIAPTTLKQHSQTIYRKVGVSNRRELTKLLTGDFAINA